MKFILGSSSPRRLELLKSIGINPDQVISPNIYESIFKNAVTGSVVIGDTKNQIARLQINGLERLSFKLTTPGQTGALDTIDASETSGNPFHVYKISDRKQENPTLTTYVLHFASREFMRNIRTKISQSFEGTLDEHVRPRRDKE